MASHPPIASEPIAHVFRLRAQYNRLEEIPAPAWQQIVRHQRPLQPANATVRLLLLQGIQQVQNTPQTTVSEQTCQSIDALQLQTDDFGFLLTWDASTTPASAPDINQSAGNVIDSRQRFLQRYIAHRHAWQPSRLLLAQALLQAGYFIRPT